LHFSVINRVRIVATVCTRLKRHDRAKDVTDVLHVLLGRVKFVSGVYVLKPKNLTKT